jgi:radical SAM protein with 4Fe4S-binding SPASM domain
MINLSTNGLVRNETLYREVLKSIGDGKIVFSLDGATAETHEKFRHNCSFTQVVEAIGTMVDLRNEVHSPAQIHINSVITRQNITELPDIVALATQKGLDGWMYQFVWPPVGEKDGFSERFGFTEADRGLLIELQDTLDTLPNTVLPKYKEMIADFFLDYDRTVRNIECYAGRAFVFVDARGDLYPCASFSQTAQRLGSLLRDEPADIRSSPHVKAVLKDAAAQRCDGCATVCHMEKNVMFDSIRRPNELVSVLWAIMRKKGAINTMPPRR